MLDQIRTTVKGYVVGASHGMNIPPINHVYSVFWNQSVAEDWGKYIYSLLYWGGKIHNSYWIM